MGKAGGTRRNAPARAHKARRLIGAVLSMFRRSQAVASGTAFDSGGIGRERRDRRARYERNSRSKLRRGTTALLALYLDGKRARPPKVYRLRPARSMGGKPYPSRARVPAPHRNPRTSATCGTPTSHARAVN